MASDSGGYSPWGEGGLFYDQKTLKLVPLNIFFSWVERFFYGSFVSWTKRNVGQNLLDNNQTNTLYVAKDEALTWQSDRQAPVPHHSIHLGSFRQTTMAVNLVHQITTSTSYSGIHAHAVSFSQAQEGVILCGKFGQFTYQWCTLFVYKNPRL